ncbi:O-antigen ligase family protein [Clostridiaceae bacterium UIB06]|uniref:O-antigen ligase family protein n=1 Tax=Clostridium thailandense TaxID=2794346 RepID=A0A949TJW7_9CLOT|nr:O-antigen ligase family protein [Clostridium thailandense]MBV7274194.1 O-antigen ligase family protein [Clostridium thailandense]MCH5137934.1 O-antigen ligase family protein [Clostridiaceae bacterium UIB06]
MYEITKKSSIYIFIAFIFLLVSSIINKNFIINGLFLLSIVAACGVTKSDSFYENIYYTLLISSIFEYASYFPRHEKLYYFHIMLVICFIATAFYILINRHELRKIDKKAVYFYTVWFIYICLSFFWSKSKDLNIKYIEIYAMMFAFVFIVVTFNTSKEKFYNSLKVVGFVFLLTVVIGMIESITGTLLPVKHYFDDIMNKLTLKEIIVLRSRPVVFFFNANNYATFLGLGIPFLMYLFYYVKTKAGKLFFGIATILTFTALVLTNSRSNILAVVLIFAVYTLVILKEGRLKALIYPLLIAVAFTGVYRYSYMMVKHGAEYEQKMIEKMAKIGDVAKMSKSDIGEEGSENVRATIIYDVVVEGFVKDKRLFGFGAGNTIQHLMDMNNTHGIYSPHGLATEMIGDFGLFTIVYGVFYLYLLYSLLLIALRQDGMNKFTAYSLLTSLIGFSIGSFSPSSVTYFLPNYVLFALSVSFIQVNKIKGSRLYE